MTALGDSPDVQGGCPTLAEEAQPLRCLGGPNLGSVGGKLKAQKLQVFSVNTTQLAPLLKFLCSKEATAGGTERAWAAAVLIPLPSELLEATIHFPFTLFPCPGPALGAELLQVLFKVLVVHGSVAGGLTVRLGTGGDEVRVHLPQAHNLDPSLPREQLLLLGPSTLSLRNSHGRQADSLAWHRGHRRHTFQRPPSYLAF